MREDPERGDRYRPTPMSSPNPDRDDRPNPEGRRYSAPGEPSPRDRAAFGVAILVCGWLVVVVSGLCTAGFVSTAGIGNWHALLTLEGLFNATLFLLIFGCIPIGGTIVMLIATSRAIKARRRGR